jgi:uncharacterized protein (TIGR03437 family)
MALSANGGQNGILWIDTGNYSEEGIPATLHALDATDLTKELWNSDQTGGRDAPGWLAKFVPPTIANGHVFLATISNSVVEYGLPGSGGSSNTAAISAVVNGASYLDGPVSPGELVTIFGANMGLATAAQGSVAGNSWTNSISGVQVTFGGLPAPLLYASSGQINAVVPFGVTGTSTQVQVLYQGNVMASATVAVQSASPALFSLAATGGGPGAILNEDGTVNSRSNPAAPGSWVSMYATGGGATSPTSVDGLLTAQPYPMPLLPVSVTIGDVQALVSYAGAAPGLVAGVMQLNVFIPEDAPAVPFDQIVLTVGDYSSPTAVTIAVQ